MHQSFPAVPISPRADPQALGFFENKPANAPRNRLKKLEFSVFELISILIKAKPGQLSLK